MKQNKNLKLSVATKKSKTHSDSLKNYSSDRNKDMTRETKINSQDDQKEDDKFIDKFSKTPYPLKIIDNDYFKNDEDLGFDVSKSISIIENKIFDKSTHSNDISANTGINFSRNKIKLNLNMKIESDKASNYLNYNLGDTKNLTMALEGDSRMENNKNNTILTINKNYIPNLEIDNSSMDSKNTISEIFQEEKSYENVDNADKFSLSLSRVTQKKLSVSKKCSNSCFFGKNMSKKLSNVSMMSSCNISILDDSLSSGSDYSDIDEFNGESRKNTVYNLKVKENNINSHLDILNLNYLLRCIFHKSEILTEKNTDNINYQNIINEMYPEVIMTEDEKGQIPIKKSDKILIKYRTKENFKTLKKMNRNKREMIFRSLSKQISDIKKQQSMSLNVYDEDACEKIKKMINDNFQTIQGKKSN